MTPAHPRFSPHGTPFLSFGARPRLAVSSCAFRFAPGVETAFASIFQDGAAPATPPDVSDGGGTSRGQPPLELDSLASQNSPQLERLCVQAAQESFHGRRVQPRRRPPRVPAVPAAERWRHHADRPRQCLLLLLLRIPTVLAGQSLGVIHAFAEGRRGEPAAPGRCPDGPDAGVVCKRSADHGVSWSALSAFTRTRRSGRRTGCASRRRRR